MVNTSGKDFYMQTTVACFKAVFQQSPGETISRRQTSIKVGIVQV
jgi:hypothetical protein